MQVIGFALTKISGEKGQKKISQKSNTSIEFVNLEKEKVDLLKDGEAIKIFFEYKISFEEIEKEKDKPLAAVEMKGHITLSVNKDESKDILKSWKKKKLPSALNINLFNLILRKCTPKTIFLEDEIGLPFHIPMPKLTPKKQD